jgi:hypothetical protein
MMKIQGDKEEEKQVRHSFDRSCIGSHAAHRINHQHFLLFSSYSSNLNSLSVIHNTQFPYRSMLVSTGSWEKEHKTSKLTKKGVTEQGSVALRLNSRINGVRLAIHGAKWGAGNNLCIGPKLLELSRSGDDPLIAALSPLLKEGHTRLRLEAALARRVDLADWEPFDYTDTALETTSMSQQFPLVYAGVHTWLEDHHPGTINMLHSARWSLPNGVRKLHGTAWVTIRVGDHIELLWRPADRPDDHPTKQYAQIERFAELTVEGCTYLSIVPIWYHQVPDPSHRKLKLAQLELVANEAYTAVDIACLVTQVWIRHNCTWQSPGTPGCYVGEAEERSQPIMVHDQRNEWEIVDAESGYQSDHTAL